MPKGPRPLNTSTQYGIQDPKLPPSTIWMEVLTLTLYSLLCLGIGWGIGWWWHTLR